MPLPKWAEHFASLSGTILLSYWSGLVLLSGKTIEYRVVCDEHGHTQGKYLMCVLMHLEQQVPVAVQWVTQSPAVGGSDHILKAAEHLKKSTKRSPIGVGYQYSI